MSDAHQGAVVLVHGLWMRGVEFGVFRRLLRRHLDARIVTFSYRSTLSDAATHAAQLGQFCTQLNAPRVNLVGHSLGGLVVLKLLESGHELAPGRVVLLGSPVQGSQIGRNLARVPIVRKFLGAHMHEVAHCAVTRRYAGDRELGIIAGSWSAGAGRLVTRLPAPNDGSVTVQETRLQGAKEHMVIRTSHTGLVFSDAVARATAYFLKHGSFSNRNDELAAYQKSNR